MENTFNGDSSLTEILGIENWNTPSIQSMKFTFNKCTSLAHLDLSNWTMPSSATTHAMFQYDDALETITLPNNYGRIDNFMFNHNSSWVGSTFTIPSSVEFVGNSHVFYNFGTDSFNKFEVEEGNTAVKTINDVLYSYDGTRLISIPRGKTFDYVTFEIPEGVTTLNELSFSRNYHIGTVVLPNSFEITNTLPSEFLNSGNNLSVGIYGYTAVSKYEVKADNPRYISNQGCIYSKDGTELIAVPLQYTGSLTIPEGTTSIRAEAFWAIEDMFYTRWMTELNIPASLTSIDEEQIARINTIVYYKNIPVNVDPANPAFEVVDGRLVAK
jgi:surface protein